MMREVEDGKGPMGRRAAATSRDEIIARIAANHDALNALGAASLALFGSAARGEMAARSDVDILVEFSGQATFDRYMDLKDYLGGLLGRRVDLVTRNAPKPALRERIAAESVHIA
jgi:uncharacterized protein